MNTNKDIFPSCPAPINNYSEIILSHGGGGKLTEELVTKIFYHNFNNHLLNQEHDGCVVDFATKKLAFTTDSYVVSPIFFPGGDIGKLAIYGTANDLAMCGAKPLYITAGFIIEEGFKLDDLWKVTLSMKEALSTSNIKLICGDTKVVEKGKGDGLFINTTGIGEVVSPTTINPQTIHENDAIIINGDIGNHSLAIMSSREGLEFSSPITSDCAFLYPLVEQLLHHNIEIHCLRDLTRGGLATCLVELAKKSKYHLNIFEKNIPINPNVQAACEIMGLDPLYLANEGKFITFVPSKQAEETLQIIRSHPLGQNAKHIGNVQKNATGVVTIENRFGVKRILDTLSGEPLPRIC